MGVQIAGIHNISFLRAFDQEVFKNYRKVLKELGKNEYFVNGGRLLFHLHNETKVDPNGYRQFIKKYDPLSYDNSRMWFDNLPGTDMPYLDYEYRECCDNGCEEYMINGGHEYIFYQRDEVDVEMYLEDNSIVIEFYFLEFDLTHKEQVLELGGPGLV